MQYPDYRAIPSTAGYDSEGVWIDGVPPHLIIAELAIFASVARVTLIRIPGYWYGRDSAAPKPTAPVSNSGQKVFLYLHGGAFFLLSAHPSAPFMPFIYRNLLQLTADASHLLSVEYRLSSTRPLPEQHPFPTALLDALAGYIHLVDVIGYDPSDIIVAGDSAGGNIALALTRYLVENKGRAGTGTPPLPAPPGRLLLISPLTDLSNSHRDTHLMFNPPGANRELARSAYSNDMDTIGDDLGGKGYPSYGALAYLGPFGLGTALYNRYISPASLHRSLQVSFTGFPRTFIVAGGAERFLDQICTLRDRMMRDMDEGQVTYYEETDGIHDFIGCTSHPGYRAALHAIGDWLARD